MHLLIKDAQLMKQERKVEEGGSLAPNGIQSHDLQNTKRVLNICLVEAIFPQEPFNVEDRTICFIS